MINEKQVDYYNILKHCVDDTIHPGYTRYTNDEVAIFVGNLNLYLKVDQKGNIYYKLPMSKPDEQTWIQWDKLSELISKVNGGFESYLRWIYEKYTDALKVGIENRVWSMDLFYKTRELIVERLEQHVIDRAIDKLTVNIDNRIGSKAINTLVRYNYYHGCLEVGGIEFRPHEDAGTIEAKLNQLKDKYSQQHNQYNIINYLTDCIFTAYTQVSPSMAIEETMINSKHIHDNIKQTQSNANVSFSAAMATLKEEFNGNSEWTKVINKEVFVYNKNPNVLSIVSFTKDNTVAILNDENVLRFPSDYINEDMLRSSDIGPAFDIFGVVINKLEKAKGFNKLLEVAKMYWGSECSKIPRVIEHFQYGDATTTIVIDETNFGQTLIQHSVGNDDNFVVSSNLMSAFRTMTLEEFLEIRFSEDNRELASNFVLFHSRVKSYVKEQNKGDHDDR